ncbi:MAG: Asp-tRNA(Asn)/Glu-tRNA(Gln) amidotransferase GatCAB subunit C [Actinobacteria bacterium HGW-Actinobacteria-10]|jgi:aspartyl-tRNA(Asn)/glutamyl-tRNA(Gln) amidotransferase subunit C|nr:MAG: Asp-tRNA(Asn)/Glu-tRNA(Gln) amidotransferase GatCAB subunit C [Actinobacteria bacterium HGW-Actinobacteria-10]
MSISEEQVRHVALLARLALSDEQVAQYGEDLNSILSHIDTIRQLDLEGVEPTAHPLEVVNVVRCDQVRPGLTREAALLNAPDSDGTAFLIPQIVGPGGDDA